MEKSEKQLQIDDYVMELNPIIMSINAWRFIDIWRIGKNIIWKTISILFQ